MASRTLPLAAQLGALILAAGVGVAQAQQGDAQCTLNFRSNFRLNGAQQYLAMIPASRFDDEKQRHLNDAARVLNEAVQSGGADPLTLWYFMGEIYGYRHDLIGADSAWRKVEAVGDAVCKRDIERRRRNEYVPVQQEAVAQLQAQHYDSALTLFRKAHRVFRGEPAGFVNMAYIFVQQDNTDSAVAYYRLAAHAGDDPQRAEVRVTALFNAARLLHRANRHAQAESAYRDYLRIKPRDMQALTGLAGVLTSLSRTQEAGAIYDSLLAHADSLESFDLFETGVALFRQAQALPAADTAARTARYQLAARAFETGLRKNPYYRDALYNLANTYVASNDTAKLLEAAQRLVAVDSMNRQAVTLLAAAYQRSRNQAATLRTLQRRDSLPWEFSVQRFDPRDTTAAIRGAVQNLRSREQPPFNITLEFVNAAGEVVTRQVVEIPTLGPAGQPGMGYDFNVVASGRGILAYRYKVN